MKKFATSHGMFFSGPCPTGEEFVAIEAAGVSLVWNLGAELDVEAGLELRNFATVVYSPIEDRALPPDRASFITDLGVVCEHLSGGGSVKDGSSTTQVVA